MNTCRRVRRLLALRPEDWSAGERRRVQEHLNVCDACSALAGRYRDQDRLLGDLPGGQFTASQREQLFFRVRQARWHCHYGIWLRP